MLDDIGSSGIETSDTEAMLKLRVRLPDGRVFHLDAAEGFRLVELLRASGLPIKAECGGSGVCATCHVRVAGNWRDALPEPGDDELARLDEIMGTDAASRLACQIVMTGALDGLEIEIQPDSLDAARTPPAAPTLATSAEHRRTQ